MKPNRPGKGIHSTPESLRGLRAWLENGALAIIPPVFLPRVMRVMRDELTVRRDLDDWTEFVFGFSHQPLAPWKMRGAFSISPSQVKSEVIELLRLLTDLNPRTVLEIGTANGGTLFLFARVADRNAKLVSIDLPPSGSPHGYPEWRERYYQSFLAEGQTLHLLRGDSHSLSTLKRVKSVLGASSVDFLFIDADHSYQGVRADFEMYAPLVRSGGLVAIHDIVPDHRTRYGRSTTADAGEVYRFWGDLKNTYATQEIVAYPNQDGCGIGVVRVR